MKRAKLKILFIENDPLICKLYIEEFQRNGYEIITAMEGTEAIQKTVYHLPDVIIMELILPDMDGVTVMQEILRINKAIPIIINSAYSNYMNDFRTWAAKAFLEKSIDMTELKSEIANVLENECRI